MQAKHLWRRAAAAVKDRRSLYLARLGRRRGFRNPDLEAAIIKATSHDESTVDYKNAQRVFAWARTSPSFLKPLMWALSKRMDNTRSWVVALKGLMLIHGVFCSKIPAVRKIGRLPFDLSNFHDRFSKPSRSAWGFSAFVRVYFSFLDQRSAFLSFDCEENGDDDNKNSNSLEKTLKNLQRSQALLDLLLQIKPYADGMNVTLILEAMDCVVIEIFEVYSGICNGIASVLVGIFSVGAVEAEMALQVLQKAALQCEQLSSYFEVCRELGVLNANEFPNVEQIPEEDIRDLKQIIYGVSDNAKLGLLGDGEETKKRAVEEEEKGLKMCDETIGTENWVVFNDDLQIIGGGGYCVGDVGNGDFSRPL